MKVCGNLIEAVGGTQLIRLAGPSEQTGCDIYGKAEFSNPGGSVKDRTALGILRRALDEGRLAPGGIVVEGTAGNTGIGLTLLASSMGIRSVIVMPETQSKEKQDTLRAIGAELILVPAVPYRDPGNYVHRSEQIARELAETESGPVLWANQFDNTANRDIHRTTTGPEIVEQLGGAPDGFICAVGTGGTLAGISAALREADPGVHIGLADPHGSALYGHYACGALAAEGSSMTEGIGQGRITANLEGLEVDSAFRIGDEEMLGTLFSLVRSDGLFLGGSSGINVAGAMHLARRLGAGASVVTILCDAGGRYQSKLYNPEFLAEKGFDPEALMHRG
ncbi:MAG: cysteine synthase A [Gammaproteobacteria bacterium AqS3]|nr:cysteine synthase A [Gammaproteobacteria bacterium AqS3]